MPLLLVNSADDPLVHDSLLAIPRTLAGNSEGVAWQQHQSLGGKDPEIPLYIFVNK